MWYFTWILGVGFACACGILNAVWHEQYLPDEGVQKDAEARKSDDPLEVV